MKLHGLKEETAILHVRYERNTLAVENAVADLAFAEHPPRAVIMVGAYAPCAKFIRQCRQADIKAVFLNVSFVGSNALARDLDKTDADVIVTQVVPSPMDQGIPIVREFNADLRAMAPAASPGFGDLEGYIAARVLLTALGRIKGEPTREAIIEALEGLGSFDAGLGEPLKLAPDEHQACHRVWPTILRDGQFVPFAWTEIAGLLGRRAAP